MWVREYQGTSTANADRLYAILADATGWHEWNPGVTRIDMDGPFAAGTAATMVLPDGGTLQFRLIWAEPGRGFEDETDVPDAGVRVRVRHELTPATRRQHADHLSVRGGWPGPGGCRGGTGG